MKPTTLFSEDRAHRYTLWREWPVQDICTFDPHPDYYPGKPDQFVQFIGLNPSKADETMDDNTIRILRGFAQRWGFGALLMTNLFAFRATQPRDMKAAADPVGAGNDHWLTVYARAAGLVVACWSAHGNFKDRDLTVKKLFTTANIPLMCFGLTANNQPRHPLRLNYRTQPKPYGNLQA